MGTTSRLSARERRLGGEAALASVRAATAGREALLGVACWFVLSGLSGGSLARDSQSLALHVSKQTRSNVEERAP